MQKFFTIFFILLLTFFIQGCQQDLEIQGSNHIYINESQPYKVISVSAEVENADSYKWKVKSKNKDYTLTNEETSAVIFHAKSAGTYTLEVKAKKGNKTFKTELEIKVTQPEVINGHTLPSEPDPTINDSTLLGIDVNNNGVRDDVERYVIKRYAQDPEFPKTKTAIAMQYAWSTQKILEIPTIESKKYSDDAIDCQFYWINNKRKNMPTLDGMKYSQKHKVFNNPELKDKIYNTRERIERKFSYNSALSGNIFSGRGENTVAKCQVNIDELGE
ncbi:MAG TPA: hypothetical protein CFH84_03325 [Sulfurimonas sp. UBA12504]|nr:MAG TPA: hypothetical protein CFH84_03325 [Sulfurimonas sp. UBA12504]